MIEDEERPARAGTPAAAPDDSKEGSRDRNDAKPERAHAGNAMNGADFQAYIGRGLRAVFDDVANQPIPDRFLELMKKLG